MAARAALGLSVPGVGAAALVACDAVLRDARASFVRIAGTESPAMVLPFASLGRERRELLRTAERIDAAAGTPRPFSQKCARQVSWLTARSLFTWPSRKLWPPVTPPSAEGSGESLAVYSCGGSCGFVLADSPHSLFITLAREPMHEADVVFLDARLSTSCVQPGIGRVHAAKKPSPI
jgi:hypothetical protein